MTLIIINYKRWKEKYCLVCRDYTTSINPKIVRNR